MGYIWLVLTGLLVVIFIIMFYIFRTLGNGKYFLVGFIKMVLLILLTALALYLLFLIRIFYPT